MDHSIQLHRLTCLKVRRVHYIFLYNCFILTLRLILLHHHRRVSPLQIRVSTQKDSILRWDSICTDMDTQNIKPEENKCTQFHFQLDHGVTEAAATNFPYLYKWNPTLNLTTVSSWQKLSSLKFTKSNKLCYTE